MKPRTETAHPEPARGENARGRTARDAPEPPATVPAPSGPGLRELKKQRTRDALLRAALELFIAQGYEGTTVDEIVEAVDVSQRTFFRHFAGKEETAFAVQEMLERHFVQVLRDRPAAEPPLEALSQAVLASWDEIGEAIERVVPVEVYMQVCRLIESTPALLAVHLRRSIETEEEIARIVADREGVDIERDPRPRVAVAAFNGVMRLTGRLWGAGGDLSVTSMRSVTEDCLNRIAPSLARHWHSEPEGCPAAAGSAGRHQERGQHKGHDRHEA